MELRLRALVLASLLFMNSAEGPTNRPSVVNGVVAAVASDLSSQDVQFQLGSDATDLSAADPEQLDSPNSILTHPCSECDWRVEVQINETMVVVIDEQTVFVFSRSDAEPTSFPLPSCNVTSTICDTDKQSIVMLCDQSPSETLVKVFRYNYSSGVLTSKTYNTLDVLLRRGALIQMPSAENEAVITYAVFPLQDKPYVLSALNVETGFFLNIEVFPLECLAVEQITVLTHTGFLLLHCSSTLGSNEISLLVFADLAKNDFSVVSDLQLSDISYDPYKVVIRCTPSSDYCLIALQNSPHIIILDLISATFETRQLENVAKDAILVDNGCAMYNSMGGLYWFSPRQVFSNDGTYELPKLVSGSANACYPPACPKFQVIEGKYVVSTSLHADIHNFVVHRCNGDSVVSEGSVEITISPAWYLPFIGLVISEAVAPSLSSMHSSTYPSSSSYIHNSTHPSTSSCIHNHTDPSSNLYPSPSISVPKEFVGASVIVPVATVGAFVLIFLVVVVITISSAVIYRKYNKPPRPPIQVVQEKESPVFYPKYLPCSRNDYFPALHKV